MLSRRCDNRSNAQCLDPRKRQPKPSSPSAMGGKRTLSGVSWHTHFEEWKRLRTLRFSLILALGLILSASAAGHGAATAQAPRLQKPRLVPTLKQPPLPPAVIDDKLVIGGEDIKARKVNTRMTVEVHVNGRPYRFLVDS